MGNIKRSKNKKEIEWNTDTQIKVSVAVMFIIFLIYITGKYYNWW